MSAGLRRHLALAFGLAVSATGTWVEWRRALGGHQLSWGYAVQWPVIGLFCIVLWHRLRDGHAGPRTATRRRGPRIPDDDPQLRAWQAYLRDLHAADPPGGPPAPISPDGVRRPVG